MFGDSLDARHTCPATAAQSAAARAAGEPGAEKSAALFARALAVTPGGVNSPVRAFRSVGGTPRFMVSGKGAEITDADGNTYVDLVGSWGPMILGHANPSVLEAVSAAVSRGLSFGTPGPGEVLLAEEIIARVPAVQQLRLVSSGTEATMSAIRLARGFTGRSKIIKFAGCYHGHVDALLASAGSGVATFALPDSAGVTAATTAEVIVLPYNDIEAVRAAFAAHPGRDRRRDHRSGRGQYGGGPAGAGLQRRPGRGRAWRWRAADHRRGDDRFPAQPGRDVRAGRGRRGLAARPDDLRQGDRRRAAGRRIRRPGRHHGLSGADRAGVPGRHAVRKSDRDRRRAGHPAGPRRRGLPPPGRDIGDGRSSWCPMRWSTPGCHTGCSGPETCSRCSSRRTR